MAQENLSRNTAAEVGIHEEQKAEMREEEINNLQYRLGVLKDETTNNDHLRLTNSDVVEDLGNGNFKINFGKSYGKYFATFDQSGHFLQVNNPNNTAKIPKFVTVNHKNQIVSVMHFKRLDEYFYKDAESGKIYHKAKNGVATPLENNIFTRDGQQYKILQFTDNGVEKINYKKIKAHAQQQAQKKYNSAQYTVNKPYSTAPSTTTPIPSSPPASTESASDYKSTDVENIVPINNPNTYKVKEFTIGKFANDENFYVQKSNTEFYPLTKKTVDGTTEYSYTEQESGKTTIFILDTTGKLKIQNSENIQEQQETSEALGIITVDNLKKLDTKKIQGLIDQAKNLSQNNAIAKMLNVTLRENNTKEFGKKFQETIGMKGTAKKPLDGIIGDGTLNKLLTFIEKSKEEKKEENTGKEKKENTEDLKKEFNSVFAGKGSSEDVKKIQNLLIEKELLKGGADGVYGGGTRNAILDYAQKATLSSEIEQALKIRNTIRESVAPYQDPNNLKPTMQYTARKPSNAEEAEVNERLSSQITKLLNRMKTKNDTKGILIDSETNSMYVVSRGQKNKATLHVAYDVSLANGGTVRKAADSKAKDANGKQKIRYTPNGLFSATTPYERINKHKKGIDKKSIGKVVAQTNVTKDSNNKNYTGEGIDSFDYGNVVTSLTSGAIATMTTHIYQLTTDIFIHGTNFENKIGQNASHGCIRMTNADILGLAKELHDSTPQVMITKAEYIAKNKHSPKRHKYNLGLQ